MAAMLDNLPLYTIGRRGKPNTIVTLVSRDQDGSTRVFDDSVVLDVDLGLAKRRLMAIKEADPENTKDCVLVQIMVTPTGRIVYDPEPPAEVDKSQLAQKEFTGYCGETAANPSDSQNIEAAWKNVPEYWPPKRDPVEIKEKKLSFLEKLKKILF